MWLTGTVMRRDMDLDVGGEGGKQDDGQEFGLHI